MTYNNANDIFETLSESKQKKEVSIVMQLAIDYARARVDDLTAPPGKKTAIGAERGTIHNALIRACNALADAKTSATSRASSTASWALRQDDRTKQVARAGPAVAPQRRRKPLPHRLCD